MHFKKMVKNVHRPTPKPCWGWKNFTVEETVFLTVHIIKHTLNSPHFDLFKADIFWKTLVLSQWPHHHPSHCRLSFQCSSPTICNTLTLDILTLQCFKHYYFSLPPQPPWSTFTFAISLSSWILKQPWLDIDCVLNLCYTVGKTLVHGRNITWCIYR